MDPDPDPDPFARGTDPGIRIHPNQNVTDPQHCLEHPLWLSIFDAVKTPLNICRKAHLNKVKGQNLMSTVMKV